MDNITIDFKGFDQKKQNLMEKVKTKFHNGKEWVVRNKELVITATPVVIGGLTKIIKVVGKRANLHKEENLRDLYASVRLRAAPSGASLFSNLDYDLRIFRTQVTKKKDVTFVSRKEEHGVLLFRFCRWGSFDDLIF